MLFCLSSLVASQGTEWKKINEAGETAYQRAEYGEAEKHFRAALAEAEKLAAQDAALATILKRLTFCLVAQGKSDEAEPVLRRLFAIQQKVLPADNPEIADSLNLLSLLTRAQRLGADDPDVAASLNNLAELYRNQGKYAEAEPLYRRSLAIREKALGRDHPDVAQSLEDCAKLLRQLKRDTEAAKLEERARAIRAKHGGTKATK